ncbi:MAG: hypothetical protein ACFB0B_16680 [Thermonemataceae bacterium]
MSEETLLRLLLLAIPISSGLIGWLTNWLAIQMTFYPIEYKGIRPFGWQGIIPSKARSMAARSVDLITSKLLKIDERFQQIDAQQIAEIIHPHLTVLSNKLVDEIMEAQARQVWKNTPEFVKRQVYQNATDNIPALVLLVMKDIQEQINTLLNIKHIAIQTLSRDRSLLNKVFQECGREEFKFLVKSGLYFGFVLGLPQMFISYYYNPWWLLPLFGLLVGYATNTIALRLIFTPREPISILGLFTLQGLFLKRQQEVAEEYATIVDQEIVTTEAMFAYVMRGPGTPHLEKIITERVNHWIDEVVGNSTSTVLVELLVGKKLSIVKNIAVYRLMEELPIIVSNVFDYTRETLDIENQLKEKMQALPPKDFESFLRPIFQEDETTLILIGASLGLLAGTLQWYFLFS